VGVWTAWGSPSVGLGCRLGVSDALDVVLYQAQRGVGAVSLDWKRWWERRSSGGEGESGERLQRGTKNVTNRAMLFSFIKSRALVVDVLPDLVILSRPGHLLGVSTYRLLGRHSF
jgi:hypothetical protein